MAGLLFKVTLCRRGIGERLDRVQKEQRLPVALSPEAVALLLHCAPSLKPKAASSGRREPSLGSMTAS